MIASVGALAPPYAQNAKAHLKHVRALEIGP